MELESFVLAASTGDLADATRPAVREYADVVEFRLDLAADPLESLSRYDGSLPILATNRPTWEGGRATDPDRLETLERATEFDAVTAIDVELASIRRGDAADLLDRTAVTVVASSHDFERTPSRATMVETLTEASTRADVAKLAVTPESTADTLALLAATAEVTAQGHAAATMAMGDLGAHTRAVAPVYGSTIGYAPADPANATAPGQLDLETLATLVGRWCPKREN